MDLAPIAGLLPEIGILPVAVVVGWWRLSHLEKSMVRMEKRLDTFMQEMARVSRGTNA